MKTTAKFALVLSVVFVCGLAISGVGFALGANTQYQHWPTWWGNGNDGAQSELTTTFGEEEKMVFSGLRGVDIQVYACDVTFEPGDQWELRYRLPPKESIKELEVGDDQILHITTSFPKVNMGIMQWERGYVTLTYPRDEKLDQVDIGSGIGRIQVTDVETRTLQLSGVSGSVEAARIICTDSFHMATVSGELIGESIQVPEMEVTSVSGDILLSTVQVTELTCEAVSGDIRASGSMSDAEINSVSGDIELTSDRELSGDIDTISGDVDVEALTDNFNCSTASGHVRVNGREERKSYSGSKSPRLDITTVSGEIDLTYTA